MSADTPTSGVHVPFDRFVKFPELTEILEALAAAYPDLMELSSIGKSYEDRDIWLCTITNTATGPHDEKPAIWIDANIHATELTGSTAALYLINKLLTQYGADDTVTRAVDTRTFYVVPRMGPDGAELAMAERPRYVRSSARPYPLTDQQDGLIAQDMDGDGRILMMRIEDANGTWKTSSADHRLLVPRDPVESGTGPYYRLLTEGEIQNFDGVTIKPAPALAGLDMNRNYPIEWRPEGEQYGAGPYPTSEPEIRAVVQGLIDRPNVCAFIQYHTYSGVHLRPYGTHADDHLPTFDLRVFKVIGQKATELTGYPAVSVYHDFKYDPKEVITGVADDWAYDHLGVYAWTTEFWSPQRAAGIEDMKFIDWWLDHPLDDDLKLLAWSDEQLGGEGFVEWYSYDHPQLGRVELGGWNTAFCFRNPPPHLLEAEVAPHADWAIWHVLIAPELSLHSTSVEDLGGDAWRIRMVVQNAGWLPTNVTQKAVDRKAVRPVEAEIVLPEGDEGPVTLVGTDAKQQLAQLSGRALKNAMLGGFGAASDATLDRAKAEWVVRGPAGATVDLVARHQRAGVVRSTVTLG
ncbi:MAG TPA: M14 family metallopeptidase [Acidimicrobiales bacterium]|nr:M14 family metallopeptidase [Acidimicrobiales bacterium]